MTTHLFRLHPNTALRESIETFCLKNTPNGGAMLTCVGSLKTARLRMAGGNEIIERDGPFEIVSLVGIWTPDGGHWHISLSDGDGNLWGGHLCTGSLIYTTAEIVVIDIGHHHPTRQHDPQTGYDELFIPQKP
jgi:predicted DNA-binding protein with PD1-like motif